MVKNNETIHEPQRAAGILPAARWRQSLTCSTFVVPMHGIKALEAFLEPTRLSNLSLAWESGAEDARTPDASRLPGVSEPRKASGVRPIYRRFPSGAGRPAVHGPNACGENERGLSMNRLTPDPSQEWSRRSSASCRFPSWEGLGVGSGSQCIRKTEGGSP